MHHVGLREGSRISAMLVGMVPDKVRRGMRERGVCGAPAAATADTGADRPLHCVACMLLLMHRIHIHEQSVSNNLKLMELTDGTWSLPFRSIARCQRSWSSGLLAALTLVTCCRRTCSGRGTLLERIWRHIFSQTLGVERLVCEPWRLAARVPQQLGMQGAIRHF